MHKHYGESGDDFFEVEIADLAPEEPSGLSGTLVDLGTRLLKKTQVVQIKLTSPKELAEDHQEQFDLYVTDLPLDEADAETLPSELPFPTSINGSNPFPLQVRNRVFFSLLVTLSLLFLLVSGGTTSIQASVQGLVNRLHPASASQPTPVAQFAGGSPGVAQSSKFIRMTDGSITIMKSSSGKLYTVVPGFVPVTCSSTPVSTNHEIGQFPLWLSNFDGPNATIYLERIRIPNLIGWNGWAVTLQISMKYNYVDPVTLTVGNAGDGPSPAFATNDGMSTTTSIVLDYNRLSNVSPQAIQIGPGVWSTTLLIPASGCYFFTAGWPRGGWQELFAAGQ